MFFATADRKVSQTSIYGICGGRSGSGTVKRLQFYITVEQWPVVT